jgi:SAM-dependent MidA family methyltransferase
LSPSGRTDGTGVDGRQAIIDAVRERGPLTVGAFMELALYHPELGYYARAARRSGRAGDFFTSVDVGPLFGELLEVQIAEMAGLIAPATATPPLFDLVEAGAGNGRLSADILNATRRRDPALYERTKLHLVERSPAARALQREVLAGSADRLAGSTEDVPAAFEGVLLANELLDAMPVHQLVMRPEGLREIFVSASPGEPLTTREGPPSTPALAEYLRRLNIAPEPGWRFEINLAALTWIRAAARRLTRGFIILIDYGREARDLYSASHAAGTLTTFSRHTSVEPASRTATPSWLLDPGARDVTAHVDFTSVRDAAEAEGMATLGFLDQTYFLLGLLDVERMTGDDLKRRLALKTLLMPGALGSTMKVLLLGKNVGTPALRGCSYRMRVT